MVDDELPTGKEIVATHDELEEVYDLKYKGARVAAPRLDLKRIVQDARDHDDAYLLRNIITAHLFEDANKRTAWTTILDYLDRHSLEPAKTEKEETDPVLNAIRAFEIEGILNGLKRGISSPSWFVRKWSVIRR
jgi:prophage maintenance system killer protein